MRSLPLYCNHCGFDTHAEIFWSKIEKSEGCWLWTGGTNDKGYGKYHPAHGGSIYAHRFVYELLKGKIPAGMQVMHSCDNPRCVRPDHLRVGTPSENMQDSVAKGRHRYVLPQILGPERAPNRKLSWKNVVWLRKPSEREESHQQIAERYGVTRETVSYAIRRASWDASSYQITRS
jgi:hypothetical protein